MLDTHWGVSRYTRYTCICHGFGYTQIHTTDTHDVASMPPQVNPNPDRARRCATALHRKLQTPPPTSCAACNGSSMPRRMSCVSCELCVADPYRYLMEGIFVHYLNTHTHQVASCKLGRLHITPPTSCSQPAMAAA